MMVGKYEAFGPNVLRACRVVDHEVDGGSASIMICANKLSWHPGGWSAGNSEPSPLLN